MVRVSHSRSSKTCGVILSLFHYTRPRQTSGSALEYARKSVELSPGTEEYILHLQTLEAKQLTSRAKLLLEQAGIATQERYVEASTLLQEAVKLDPLSVEAHVMLALAYSDLNEFDYAIQAAREAILLDPQNGQLHQMLQEIKQRMKSIQ